MQQAESLGMAAEVAAAQGSKAATGEVARLAELNAAALVNAVGAVSRVRREEMAARVKTAQDMAAGKAGKDVNVSDAAMRAAMLPCIAAQRLITQ